MFKRNLAVCLIGAREHMHGRMVAFWHELERAYLQFQAILLSGLCMHECMYWALISGSQYTPLLRNIHQIQTMDAQP